MTMERHMPPLPERRRSDTAFMLLLVYYNQHHTMSVKRKEVF